MQSLYDDHHQGGWDSSMSQPQNYLISAFFVFLFFIYALKELELICNLLNPLKVGPQGVGTHVSQPPSSAADDDDGGLGHMCPNPLMTNF